MLVFLRDSKKYGIFFSFKYRQTDPNLVGGIRREEKRLGKDNLVWREGERGK